VRLGLSRSSRYDEPTGESAEDLRLMRLIDEQYTPLPHHGSRRMTMWLIERGEGLNRKRVRRLMRIMGLEATYPKPRPSRPGEGHRIHPYLLRCVKVERPDQVRSAEITSIPMAPGFLYLAAVIDWLWAAVSMDGRGRALDDVFVERLWRSVKYEDIYIRSYATVPELHRGLSRYFGFYNGERLHQSLDYRTQAAVYRGASITGR
jgi:putative transposase